MKPLSAAAGKLLLTLLLSLLATALPGKSLLEIEGDYLFYSYDHNYILGHGQIRVITKDFVLQGDRIEIDVSAKRGVLSGVCRVEFKGETHTAECVELDLQTMALRLVSFGDQLRIVELNKPPDAGADAKPPAAFSSQTFQKLKKSLAYFVNRRIVIQKNYSAVGYQSTLFVEGVQSVSFRKFKLDKGLSEINDRPFTIDKIWYYNTQGLVVNSSLQLEKKDPGLKIFSDTSLDLQYDILGTIASGSRGKAYLSSKNNLDLSEGVSLNLKLDYITENNLDAVFNLRHQWGKTLNSEWTMEYNKSFQSREELWLRWNSNLNLKRWGAFQLNLAYEKQNQHIWEFSYRNQAFKRLAVSFRYHQSSLWLGPGSNSQLDNASFSLSYSTRLLNVAADYTLNRDLLNDQSQANPQFKLNFVPFKFYHGLLQVNIASTFVITQTQRNDLWDSIYRANLTAKIDSERIQLSRGTEVSFSLAAEQLIDKDPLSNYTSLGYIVKGKQDLFGVADLEFLYSYHARRRTEFWLIKGTSSQDWTSVLRLKENRGHVNGWLSLSFDTKTGHFTTGYLDCIIDIIKDWKLQTQLNYDFFFDRFNYVFYLLRKAGRFTLRLSYRSLSKQFLFEFLPGGG